MCALFGRVLKTNTIKQKVSGTYYIVNKDECAIILKRLHSVYDNDFCMMFRE